MSITPESVDALIHSADLGDRLRGVNQLRSLEPAVAYALLQPAIEDPNPRVRYAAVSQLASLGDQDRAKTQVILLERLRDSDPDVQAAAADSIGALKLTDTFEHLVVLYERTSEWLIQFSIIAALGELGDPRGFELLEHAIQSENELMRMAAIGSFGELGDVRAVPLLIPFAQNDDWQVRYRIAQALSHLSTPDSTAVLQTLAQDPVEQVAQEAQSGLAKR